MVTILKGNKKEQKKFAFWFVLIVLISPFFSIFYPYVAMPPLWGIYVISFGPTSLFIWLFFKGFQTSKLIKKYKRFPVENNVLFDTRLIEGAEATKLAKTSHIAAWLSLAIGIIWCLSWVYLYWL